MEIPMPLFTKLRSWARSLKREIYVLYLATRDPRTPWYAKAFAACVVAYALSPIDLIPDFVPILGYLDDLILLPIGLYFAIKLIPEEVMKESRIKAADQNTRLPKNLTAGLIIGLLWLGCAALILWLLLKNRA